MAQQNDRSKLGPYVLMKTMAPLPLASRSLAIHEVHHTSHVIYRFPVCHDNAERRRFLSSVQTACTLNHSHILKIEQYSFDSSNAAWVITPFTGDADGLLTLERLLRAKNGRMHPDEAERAIVQLLEAFDYAHQLRQYHGPLSMDEVLIDRHGSLLIELFGMSRLAQGLTGGNSELIRDEVRSVVEIGYQLITGLRAEEPIIPAGRLLKRLDPRWDRWFDQGLDPAQGFDSTEEAMAFLPSLSQIVEPKRPSGPVRSVLGRLWTAKRI
ncbi:MAG: protein kinase [Pyrinomonadaceae bacterium]|nr:protein kinase [Phycisphaerales bacterium]